MKIKIVVPVAAAGLVLAGCGAVPSSTAESAPTVTVTAPGPTVTAPAATVTAPAPTVTVTAPAPEPEPEEEEEVVEEEQSSSEELSAPTGTAQQVGSDWDVVLDSIDTSRSGEITAYLTSTYIGSESGNPYWDFMIHLNGGDSVQYDEHCTSYTDTWGDAPTLNPGGTTSFSVCLQIPNSAVGEETSLVVSETVAWDDSGAAVWELSYS